MKPVIDVPVPCPRCREPFHVTLDTKTHRDESGQWVMSFDGDHLYLAVRAHIRSHQP